MCDFRGEERYSLLPPASFIYTGPMSTRGRNLNRFALSLKEAPNRSAFLVDEESYMSRYALTIVEKGLVRERDWTALLHAGGHLQAVLKIAATVGQSLWHIGAHNADLTAEELISACPRKVTGLPKGL